jgi:hypothetical protein
MKEGGSGMKRSDDDQRIGRHFVNPLYGAGKRSVGSPRRSYLSQTKQRQRVSTRELQDDPGNWSRD